MSLVLVAVISLSSLAAFCDRQTFTSNARAAAASYHDAEPLFRQLGIPTVRLTQVIDIADELVTAFDQNRDADAVELVASLITRTNEIIGDEITLIKDEHKRANVMAVLAIGNIALHWISANLVKQGDSVLASGNTSAAKGGIRAAAIKAVSEHAAAVATIRDFASQPAWGRQYAR